MPTLLEDKDSIRELIYWYCNHVESGAGDKWVNLFVEDCIWDGGPHGRHDGHDGLRKIFNTRDPGRRHVISNTVIHVEGDEAWSISHVTLNQFKRPGYDVLGGGYYIDHFVRNNDRWRFKRRNFRSRVTPNDTALLKNMA
jgi:ketosteroid isomerase-like protein